MSSCHLNVDCLPLGTLFFCQTPAALIVTFLDRVAVTMRMYPVLSSLTVTGVVGPKIGANGQKKFLEIVERKSIYHATEFQTYILVYTLEKPLRQTAELDKGKRKHC